jgi:hypothetical protein
LALDDDQRHAFVGHLDGVGVTQLVRREPAPHSCGGSDASQLSPCRGGRPVASACGAVDDAQHWTNRELAPDVKPGLELFLSPSVHADLPTAPTLAAPDQQRAAALVEIALGESERFVDAQPGSPHDHDWSA